MSTTCFVCGHKYKKATFLYSDSEYILTCHSEESPFRPSHPAADEPPDVFVHCEAADATLTARWTHCAGHLETQNTSRDRRGLETRQRALLKDRERNMKRWPNRERQCHFINIYLFRREFPKKSSIQSFIQCMYVYEPHRKGGSWMLAVDSGGPGAVLLWPMFLLQSGDWRRGLPVDLRTHSNQFTWLKFW